MDLFNLPLLLCAAASTLAFVTITQTSGCESSTTTATITTNSSQSQSRNRSRKWKGEGGAVENDANEHKPEILDDRNLENSKNSRETLFIDLYAPWCGHCKALAPIWDKFVKDCENLQTIRVMKCDAEKNTDCSTFFKVETYPTIVLYKNGEITEYEGARTVTAFCEFLKEHCK